MSARKADGLTLVLRRGDREIYRDEAPDLESLAIEDLEKFVKSRYRVEVALRARERLVFDTPDGEKGRS